MRLELTRVGLLVELANQFFVGLLVFYSPRWLGKLTGYEPA